jgi:hypothetical protein
LFPSNTRVKCLADAGMFLDTYVQQIDETCFPIIIVTQLKVIFAQIVYLLMRIDHLTFCSVDVSGRWQMRSFFNGIVRLQVCVCQGRRNLG